MGFGDEELGPQMAIEKFLKHDYEPAPAIIDAGS
jgi:hypothetical protein